MFIEALFIKQDCPLVNEWVNKLYYIQTMEYYSEIKRNED